MSSNNYLIKTILVFIFLITLGIRLYVAFQLEGLSDADSYFLLRNVEHITKTGTPLFHDPLSYGGRFLLFNPVYAYLLAFFSLGIPTLLVIKILPNIFASSFIFIAYLIAEDITKTKDAALFTALIAGFIPIFVTETFNTGSVYTLMIFGTFLLAYLFIKKERNFNHFVIALVALLLFHPSSFIILLAMGIYLIIALVERIELTRGEIEVTIFALLFYLWFYFLMYKDALLYHGLGVIWQNIPSSLLAKHFTQISVLQAIYQIGIIPFICGIWVIYKSLVGQKRKAIFFLLSFAIAVSLLLWLKLIAVTAGLMFLGSVLALLFSEFFRRFFEYLEKTKLAHTRTLVIVILSIVFVITSLYPTVASLQKQQQMGTTKQTIAAFTWLVNNTYANSSVITPLEEGHLVTALGQRKNIADAQFLLIDDVDERLQDLEEIYTTPYKTNAIAIANKYHARYILLSERTMERYNINSLPYADRECFVLTYAEGAKIYESLCILEER
ncbi:glycosyltransferase family 39 protein [Candidatus Woesearchaeota archaeon]|nr:glycosyltransferase family 39 protein [Candidatus Woesearchaeota archaeon]